MELYFISAQSKIPYTPNSITDVAKQIDYLVIKLIQNLFIIVIIILFKDFINIIMAIFNAVMDQEFIMISFRWDIFDYYINFVEL